LKEAEHKILLSILEQHLYPEVKQWFEIASNDTITEQDIKQSCRDTAHVLIIFLQQELIKSINNQYFGQFL
jgi:hypothetical protein